MSYLEILFQNIIWGTVSAADCGLHSHGATGTAHSISSRCQGPFIVKSYFEHIFQVFQVFHLHCWDFSEVPLQNVAKTS